MLTDGISGREWRFFYTDACQRPGSPPAWPFFFVRNTDAGPETLDAGLTAKAISRLADQQICSTGETNRVTMPVFETRQSELQRRLRSLLKSQAVNVHRYRHTVLLLRSVKNGHRYLFLSFRMTSFLPVYLSP